MHKDSWPSPDSPFSRNITPPHPVLDVSNYDGVSWDSAIGQDTRVSKEGDLRRSVYVQKGRLRANKIMLIYRCRGVYVCTNSPRRAPTQFVDHIRGELQEEIHRTRAGAREL